MTFAKSIGYEGNKFPHAIILKNGAILNLCDENGGYLGYPGYGVSNPWIGIPPSQHASPEKAWKLIAQRFFGGQPKKGEVTQMAAYLAGVNA